MTEHGVRRLACVSSSAVDPHDDPAEGWVFNRVLQPYVVNGIGKTTYDDMRAHGGGGRGERARLDGRAPLRPVRRTRGQRLPRLGERAPQRPLHLARRPGRLPAAPRRQARSSSARRPRCAPPRARRTSSPSCGARRSAEAVAPEPRTATIRAACPARVSELARFRRRAQSAAMISRISAAVSDGVLPTLTPAASRASFLRLRGAAPSRRRSRRRGPSSCPRER